MDGMIPEHKKSKWRKLLERDLLPSLDVTGEVLWLGLRPYCRYAHYFPGATRYDTLDIDPDVCPTIVADICCASGVPSASYDWVFFNGMFELVSNPFDALREISRILRTDGHLFLGAPFKADMGIYDDDKWRITPKGVQAYLADYAISSLWNVDDQYLYALAAKVE